MKKILYKIWFQPYTPVIIVLLVVFAVYRFGTPTLNRLSHLIKSEKTAQVNKGDSEASPSASAIIAKVGELIDLPTDEEPQIVTITDIEKFRDQPFFKKAHNGDTLLVYQKNKKIYLYSKEGKMLDVAPITDATESAKQLQAYCANLASQSAQLTSQLPAATVSATLGEATASATPSATPTP